MQVSVEDDLVRAVGPLVHCELGRAETRADHRRAGFDHDRPADSGSAGT